MRRALLAAVLCAAACDDPSAAPAAAAAAAPAPAAEAPFELVFDDARLDALVFDAARSASLERLSSLTLPPRCDRVRVAVHALHEHLLGARTPPPDRAQVLAALDALTKAAGGAAPKALGPLVAAWRGWDDAQAAAEAALARRAAAAFAVLARPQFAVADLTDALRGSQEPPPASPAAAELAVLRGAELALAAPAADAVPRDVADAWTHAEELFEALGWPGGFGSSADVVARRLLASNPSSRIAINLADRAQAAYARSGDEVRASLVFLALSDAAERRGDLKTAEYLADGGRERLLAAHGCGRELYDVELRHGSLAQILGRQQIAARDLGRAWDEARAARLGAAECVVAAEKLATSQFLLGRFADAHDTAVAAAKIHDDAVAAGAAAIEPSRTELAGIAAQAALETGRPADAARMYRDAAARHAAAAAADPSEWQRHDTDALLAAQAQLRAGDADGAVRAIAEVTSRKGVAAPARAHASSILREAKRFAEAEAELSRAEAEGGDEFKAELTEERARLAAARGDLPGARTLYAAAIARVQKDPNVPVGWDAARVLLDWARMELAAGRLFEASDLAGRAIVELRGSGLEMELDRARELYVGIERRRLWFGEAEKAAAQRLAAGPPGGDARRDDALLDHFLIRMELALQKQKDAEKSLLAAAEAFPEGWRRELATQVANAVTGEDPWSPRELVAVPADAPARWKLLRDVVSGTGDASDILRRCGADEPELRRFAAPRLEQAGGDLVGAMELRRRSDRSDVAAVAAALAPDEAVLLVEQMTSSLMIVVVRAGRPASGVGVTDDAGLSDFWDAVWVDPSPAHLTASARRVSDALLSDEIAEKLDGVKRLYVSVSEPLGPLPYDLLPFGDGLLIDRFEVITVNSLTELTRARKRPAPPLLSTLASPYASLDERHALVALGAVDPKAWARLFELMGRFQNQGRDASSALREAKLALRAEWKPDPAARPVVPPWAAILLRGAR